MFPIKNWKKLSCFWPSQAHVYVLYRWRVYPMSSSSFSFLPLSKTDDRKGNCGHVTTKNKPFPSKKKPKIKAFIFPFEQGRKKPPPPTVFSSSKALSWCPKFEGPSYHVGEEEEEEEGKERKRRPLSSLEMTCWMLSTQDWRRRRTDRIGRGRESEPPFLLSSPQG